MPDSTSQSLTDPSSIELPAYPPPVVRSAQSQDSENHESSGSAPVAAAYPALSVSIGRQLSYYACFQRWWTSTVSVSVLHRDHDFRDFLALERTYLAYTRSALALGFLSVFVAQLYIITDYDSTFPDGTEPTSHGLTFKRVGKPLSVALDVGAIIIACIGGARYMRQQTAILNKKAYAGGMDFIVISLVALGLCSALFVTQLLSDP